jgi:hypothetical protein
MLYTQIQSPCLPWSKFFEIYPFWTRPFVWRASVQTGQNLNLKSYPSHGVTPPLSYPNPNPFSSLTQHLLPVNHPLSFTLSDPNHYFSPLPSRPRRRPLTLFVSLYPLATLSLSLCVTCDRSLTSFSLSGDQSPTHDFSPLTVTSAQPSSPLTSSPPLTSPSISPCHRSPTLWPPFLWQKVLTPATPRLLYPPPIYKYCSEPISLLARLDFSHALRFSLENW